MGGILRGMAGVGELGGFAGAQPSYFYPLAAQVYAGSNRQVKREASGCKGDKVFMDLSSLRLRVFALAVVLGVLKRILVDVVRLAEIGH